MPDPEKRGRDYLPLSYIETEEEKKKKCEDGLSQIRKIRQEAGL